MVKIFCDQISWRISSHINAYTGSFPELYTTFHLHYISFALHLKNLPRQHKMHATSRFKCHALHLHFMK